MMYFEATDANPLDLVHPSGDLTPFYKFLAKYRQQQVCAALYSASPMEICRSAEYSVWICRSTMKF